MPIVEQLWTYERLLAEFPAESRVELIHNEIYMPPAPSLEHQETVSELGFLLQSFVRNGVLGKVFYAPFDVLLDANTVVQPDIVFVRKTNLQVLTQRGCEGIPNLVVEIISPSTFYRDSVEKFE
ncbi:MAG: Uma2 family endonuclease, partial [Flammeovirgaceae bacterium]|nr:Uma2 family endonuclease [Flammeovirgaceae bacterium]